eukprot:357415-Chlamydomonas_euryale.AAC.12
MRYVWVTNAHANARACDTCTSPGWHVAQNLRLGFSQLTAFPATTPHRTTYFEVQRMLWAHQQGRCGF